MEKSLEMGLEFYPKIRAHSNAYPFLFGIRFSNVKLVSIHCHSVNCVSCCSLSSYFTQTVARGGITVSAIFNYKLTPELSTEICHQNSQIEINKCIKIHHEWADNEIVLAVWYQLRKIKMCRTLGMTYVSAIYVFVQRVAIFVHNSHYGSFE